MGFSPHNMMDKQLAWLEEAQIQRPGAAAELSELGELYDKKLWHQLTLKLSSALGQSSFQQDAFLIQLYRLVGSHARTFVHWKCMCTNACLHGANYGPAARVRQQKRDDAAAGWTCHSSMLQELHLGLCAPAEPAEPSKAGSDSVQGAWHPE